MDGPHRYQAPLDGARCLQVAGRMRRQDLPAPFLPPPERPGNRCFLCHPAEDAWDRGAWPEAESRLRILGNAHPYGPLSLLLAPAGPRWHEAVPQALSDEDLERLCLAAWQPALARFVPAGLEPTSFLNHGRPSGQSQRHLHSQVVGLSVEPPGTATLDAVEQDLEAAGPEGRLLPLEGSGLSLVLPRRPSMTLEAWVVGFANPSSHPAPALRTVLTALTRHLTGNFNLVALTRPRLLRVVPRGVSERAGLEFALPGRVDAVVACSPEESRQSWQQALTLAERADP